MPQYNSQQLREEILNPLTTLLAQFSEGISRLETYEKGGKIGDSGLPLSIKGAVAAVRSLKNAREELYSKLEAATDGRLEILERKRLAMEQLRRQRAKKSR